MSSSSRIQRALAVVVVVAAAALLASGFLVGATPDEEEFRFTVLTSWLHVRALADGNYAFWTSLLGFGVPQPLIGNYWFHPLLPLLAFMSPAAWMRLVLLVHSVLGAAGMWRLCRTLDVRPIVSAVCAATFLLATPSQNYVLTDFWPSPWMALTMMPWVLLCAWRVLHAPERVLQSSALLGLLGGLIVANGNPGNVAVYGVLVVALLLVHCKAAAARWRALALAGAIVLALTAPNAALLAAERGLFPPELAASGGSDPVRASVAWDVFLRPLSASGDPWQADVVARGARTLFFGGPFAVLCLVACARGGWQRPELVVALAMAALPMLTAAAPAMGASDRFLFRDPIVLCAIPLAGMAAERGLRRARTRAPVAVLLAAQLLVVSLAVLPFLSRTWIEGRQGAQSSRGAIADQPVADAIVEAMSVPGRLLYSPQVDYDVRERALLAAGLGVNALAYRGVPVVNGWFKGVSADPIWPDERSYYSRIRTPPALLESGPTLDVLGVRYVLASRDEAVASDLRAYRRLETSRLELVLYENDDAWPGAFLVGEEAAGLELPLLDGCENDRLLCRDLSPVAARARHTDVSVLRREGAIDVSLDPVETSAVLVITEMFRPEWRATSNAGVLPTAPFAGALLGVSVPPGVTSVRVFYQPWTLIATTIVAWSAFVAAVVLLAATVVVQRWKDRASRYHRRILSRHIISQTLERRAATLPARVAIPGPAEREAALRAASPAYVAAVADGPASFGNQVHRMTVQGLQWWMPVLRPRPEGPSEDWIHKERFPYLALTQTRELAIGGIMLDLGANTGRMSIPRVVLGDVVAAYCAEPDPLNYACLVGNIVDNGLAGLLLPDRVAIGDRDGSVTLSRGKYSGGHRVLTESASPAQPASERFEVPCLTLDTWLRRLEVDPDAVTFVKVDVQGFETRVLQGAAGLLARRHVAWQLEMEPELLTAAGSSLAELCEKLRRHFSRFIDLKAELTGPRDRPIDEITDALGYLGTSARKTDVLVF